eukprot:ctg_130.g118
MPLWRTFCTCDWCFGRCGPLGLFRHVPAHKNRYRRERLNVLSGRFSRSLVLCTITTGPRTNPKPKVEEAVKTQDSKNGSLNEEQSLNHFLAEKGYRVEDSVILFDGECNLCNGSVNFVLDHDKDGLFKFTALQSPVGKALLSIYDGPMDMSSVLIEKGKMLLKSDAILRIAELLENKFLRVLARAVRGGLPRWLRDWVYTEIISKYRRQVFGETESCRLMEPGWEDRFL